jgi:alginate O-acetyltransferase complex protein AlgI
MLFVQFRFLIFFLIVCGVYWSLRSAGARKFWLLVASHFFYACLFLGGPDSANADTFPVWTFCQKLRAHEPLPIGWWFPAVLWVSTLMDYTVGLALGNTGSESKRRLWLLVSLGVNLGVLCVFKYANFALDSIYTGLNWLGLHPTKPVLSIFLPYGISFYTFQSMSYSIDVYRRRIEPVRSFLDLAFFISFFPQLVAGPIVRASSFLPQVFTPRCWALIDVRGGLALFFLGFLKKACISENVAPISDALFAAPWKYDVYSTFVGVGFYAIQIYCDFSGYTDMAIAASRLLGYELTPNFDFPYFARNITEFWRKWHISLSTWLRDYLYIPLGGNRGSKAFVYRNLLFTMVLGGLWHGASWTFVLWGGLHGLGLIVHREAQHLLTQTRPVFRQVLSWLSVPITFHWVLVTWVLFRAQDVYDAKTHELKRSALEVAKSILKSLCLFQNNGDRSFSIGCLWLFLGLAVLHFANSRHWLSSWWRRLPAWLFAALLGAGFGLALFFVPSVYKPFIYFQF